MPQIIKKETEKVDKELTVLAKEIETNDGAKFISFKYVDESGRLVDLRFRRDVDAQNLFKGLSKFKIHVGYFSDASARFEYPRAYAGDLISDIEVII